MKPSIVKKLENLVIRSNELKELLSDPKVTNDINRYRNLSREYSQLEPYIRAFLQYQEYVKQLEEANVLLEEKDSHPFEKKLILTIQRSSGKFIFVSKKLLRNSLYSFNSCPSNSSTNDLCFAFHAATALAIKYGSSIGT